MQQKFDAHGKIFLCTAILAIIAFSLYLQTQFMPSADIIWCYMAAERLFDGGDYVKDFLETNPPLILYFNYPVILISRWLTLDPILILRLYIFALSFLSLGLSFHLVNKIFPANQTLLANFFKVILCVAMLIIPLHEFGQREHITFILTLPYFLLATMRIQNASAREKRWLAIGIGIFAAIGFGLKPYFLAPLILVELFVALKTKKLFLRAETVSLFIGLLIYCWLVLHYFPTYIHVLLPYFSRVYYLGIGKPFLYNLTNANSLFVLVALLFYLTQIKYSHFKILNTILFLATIGFYISYFVGRTNYYYHVLPAFGFGFCFLTLLYAEFLQRKINTRQEYILLALFTVAALSFWLLMCRLSWVLLALQPIPFFLFFALLFFVSLLIASSQRNIFKLILITASICIIGYYFSYLTRHTEWYTHDFLLTITVLMLMFCLLNSNQNKIALTVKTLLGAIIFTYPFSFFLNQHNDTQQITLDIKQGVVVNFIKQHAKQQPISFLSTNSFFVMPTLYYSQAKLGSRFEFFWMLPGLIKQEQITPQSHEFLQDKNFFITMIAEDLKKYKPVYVFVDTDRFLINTKLIHLNYLTYLNTNSFFRSQWKHYRYVTTLKSDEHKFPPRQKIFDVYQRIS